MTRYLYPGDTGVQAGSIDPADAYLAPGSAFTVWTDDQGGDNVSADMRARDGVTVLDLVSDGTGNYPALRGPDDVTARVLWRDTGASIRYPMYPVDALNFSLGASRSLQDLEARIAALEEVGGTTSGGGGNVYMTEGATSPRIDERTGANLPAGARMIWIANRLPDAYVEGLDYWANRP